MLLKLRQNKKYIFVTSSNKNLINCFEFISNVACYLLAFELFSLSDSVLADVGSSRSDDDSALERLSVQAERRGTL